MERLKVGILFGGPSREREISFAGGRTVYDNLDKSLFEPIPIFIDAFKNMVILDWQYIYKGTIRDFYPTVDDTPKSTSGIQVYSESIAGDASKHLDMLGKIGEVIRFDTLKERIDFAFLALHGNYGEDGQVQAILESYQIPYSGSGVFACATGIDKSLQKSLMKTAGYEMPEIIEINRHELQKIDWDSFYTTTKNQIKFPLVVRPANQGSSIGVSILQEDSLLDLRNAIEYGFFQKRIDKNFWLKLNGEEKIKKIQEISDIRSGLGFPLYLADKKILHPDDLILELDAFFTSTDHQEVLLRAEDSESKVIIESFIEGKEFSCVVIKDLDGKSIALPPTEIRKNSDLYDYKSKYLPGLSRKVTPIELETKEIERVQHECIRLFEFLKFDVYARIDGFYSNDGKIILNDPNTTSGMLPSSFFFHQAAEIGFNPSQFISYIIYTSIQDRIKNSRISDSYQAIFNKLKQLLQEQSSGVQHKIPVGVIFGGYSFERHISVESGRNIYEKLSSSSKYKPIPLFLKKANNEHGYELYKVPINLLLKDNADDIADKIDHFKIHEVTEATQEEAKDIMQLFLGSNHVLLPELVPLKSLADLTDRVFIALHGRPGEDGSLQSQLEKYNIRFNGSGVVSSQTTIHKFNTLQTLKKEGFTVAKQSILTKSEYHTSPNKSIAVLEKNYDYPFIVKPVDDGCSSAVSMIKDQKHLIKYLTAIFRDIEDLDRSSRSSLGIGENEEFPMKEEVLIESLIHQGDAPSFMEITSGLLTHYDSNGEMVYEMLEPSETLATGEILSLEEKFLAGEGQNITPARLGNNKSEYDIIVKQVKSDLERAAKILDVQGYARIDAFVRVDEKLNAETIIIEVNSLPGMTPATCIFHQAALNQYKPYDFIDKILEFAVHE